jgi:hypothetical protein
MWTSTVRSSTSDERPHTRSSSCARKHPPRPFDQTFEQPKIDRTQANVALAPPDAPSEAIEIEVSDIESFGDAFRPAAPKKRMHTGHQFDHRERLDDIVICADREAAHALRFFVLRGDHDDRQGAGRLARPQTPADLDARNTRQHPVENEEIGRGFGQALLGFVAAPDALHEIAFSLQIIADQQRDIDFVFDDQNAGR